MINQTRIRKLVIGDQEPVKLMAAINLSQESFYKGSVINFNDESELMKKFTNLIDQGTDIIDLGPKSTAPINIYGKDTAISVQEEINRIKLPLQILHNLSDEIVISVDTQSSEVADYALKHGTDIINDISGLKLDSKMSKVIGDYSACTIVMATDKKPGDVVGKKNVIRALEGSLSIAKDYIRKENIIIDPGIGGWIPERTPEDDFQLILDTPAIKEYLQCPALIALSRKSFIGKTLNLQPSERLYGSLSATAISVLYGANIIRTHDIRETREAIIIAEKFKKLILKN